MKKENSQIINIDIYINLFTNLWEIGLNGLDLKVERVLELKCRLLY